MCGALPIPIISAVKDYCEFYYITDVDERDLLARHVARMDEAYMAYISKKQNDNKPK